MVSADEVPFCFAGCDALDSRRVVLIPGLTGSPSHRIVLTTSEAGFDSLGSGECSISGYCAGRLTRAINLAARHDRPDNTCRLIGQRDRDQASRLSRQQSGKPGIDGIGLVFRASNERGHAYDEKPAQIFVAHLRYPPKPFLAAARMLQWREAQPGGEL